MNERATYRLQLVAAAALFSTGGAAIKATELGSWQVASFRSGIAALAVLLLVPAARRGWSWHVLPVGLAYAVTMVLFVVANKLTTAANTIFLQATAPLYILLLGPWLLRERIRRADLALMVAVGAGLALFFAGVEEPVSTAPDPVRGNMFGALSGFTWALTVMGLRWMGSREDAGSPITTVAAGNALAFLIALPAALPVAAAGTTDWLVILYLGVFQIGLAYLLLTSGIRHVSAFEASTLLLVEPALSPVWAWLLHGEEPGGWALLGGALILGATFAKTWWDARVRRRRSAYPYGGETPMPPLRERPERGHHERSS